MFLHSVYVARFVHLHLFTIWIQKWKNSLENCHERSHGKNKYSISACLSVFICHETFYFKRKFVSRLEGKSLFEFFYNSSFRAKSWQDSASIIHMFSGRIYFHMIQ